MKTHPLTMIERLRIENTVWKLDLKLADLPPRAAKLIRREVRANLQAAAAEVGTGPAIEGLGNLHRLALEYMSSEYGSVRRRPSLRTAVFWEVAYVIVLFAVAFSATGAFTAGVLAADPSATGHFAYHGLSFLGLEPFFDLKAGQEKAIGMEVGPLSLGIFLIGPFIAAFVGGRYWRMWTGRRRTGRPHGTPAQRA